MFQIAPELQEAYLVVVALGDFSKSSVGPKVVPEDLFTEAYKLNYQKLDQLRGGFVDLLSQLRSYSEQSQAKGLELAEQVVLPIDLMHSFVHGMSVLMTLWPNLHPDQPINDLIAPFVGIELQYAELIYDLGSQYGVTAEHCQQVIATTERGNLVGHLAWTDDLTRSLSSLLVELHRTRKKETLS